MTYFPQVEPHQTGYLEAPPHRIYYEVSGNPNGKPVLFVHGGPGGGTSPEHRRYWDPAVHRIVLVDQRGCGRSTPHASLESNTTWDLVADMERIRVLLGIERWQVFGGSWGSTLALAYAETHPERVSELVLRGIFLLRQEEVHWYYQDGASRIFPDCFEAFQAPIPVAERGNMVEAYYARLTSPDAGVRIPAARAWSTWEGRTSKLIPDPGLVAKTDDPYFAEAFARIECHYFIHKGFFQRDDELLANAHRIAHIPCVIVQGRYDVVCPAKSAWDLHKALPQSELVIVQDAGHAAAEPGIAEALVRATERFKTRQP